mmetsp:Transcript_2495/g.6524  ORF Transcript_2495/g.6524 Transcript_2495/m.6524 type:complete len:295 (-) Transcript_2495:29-913(-)
MDFRNQIPLAEPYQWDSEEECDDCGYSIVGSLEHTAAGTGTSRIQQIVSGGARPFVSDEATTILAGLLESTNAWGYGDRISTGGERGTIRQFPDITSYDIPASDLMDVSSQSVIDLAKEGRLSLFCSILRLFRDGEELSTPNIIRACSHAIRPADVPPDMDAKEVVMAALHFLSSSVPELNLASQGPYCENELVDGTFPSMPILLSSNIDDNLDRRSYTKCIQMRNGRWSMDDEKFRLKVLKLERAFMASSVSNPSRLRMCPRVEDKDAEAKLLASGTLPAASKAKSGGIAKKK